MLIEAPANKRSLNLVEIDAGLIVVFNDRAGLDAYAVNPEHVPVAQYGASLCEQIVAVDFE